VGIYLTAGKHNVINNKAQIEQPARMGTYTQNEPIQEQDSL
jgi:hypothetical protein